MVAVVVVAVVTVTYAINTLKIRMVAAQRVWAASLLEATQGLAFVYGMLRVLDATSGWVGTGAYVAGAGLGTLVTMLYERRRGGQPVPTLPAPHRHDCCPPPHGTGSTAVPVGAATRTAGPIDTSSRGRPRSTGDDVSWLSRLLGTDRRPAPATDPEPAAPMGQMVRMLADAPDEQREAMLSDRLQVFASQDDADRQTAMRAMLVAALDLPADDYRSIAASRLRALQGMEPPQRMALARSHAQIVRALPEGLRDKELATMQAVVGALPAAERAQVTAMMQQTGLMPS